MASMPREPFPKILSRALLWPFAVFAIAWVVAIITKGNQATAGFWLVATAVAGAVEIVAVPTATYLLVRDGRYRTAGNFAMTASAALPLIVIAAVVLLFSGALGTFHI
jgi:hypothetical protein